MGRPVRLMPLSAELLKKKSHLFENAASVFQKKRFFFLIVRDCFSSLSP